MNTVPGGQSSNLYLNVVHFGTKTRIPLKTIKKYCRLKVRIWSAIKHLMGSFNFHCQFGISITKVQPRPNVIKLLQLQFEKGHTNLV